MSRWIIISKNLKVKTIYNLERNGVSTLDISLSTTSDQKFLVHDTICIVDRTIIVLVAKFGPLCLFTKANLSLLPTSVTFQTPSFFSLSAHRTGQCHAWYVPRWWDKDGTTTLQHTLAKKTAARCQVDVRAGNSQEKSDEPTPPGYRGAAAGALPATLTWLACGSTRHFTGDDTRHRAIP